METVYAIFSSLLTLFFIVTAVALILVILVQRPQGGGLSGAFGSGGGSSQSAFGAKTGDVLTAVTVGVFILFLGSAIASVMVTDARYSDEASAAERPPAAPSDITVEVTSPGEVTITWVDNSEDEEGFNLQRSLDPQITRLPAQWETIGGPLPADTTSYVDTDVEPGMTYFYRLESFRGELRSEYTAARTTIPFEEEPMPTPGEQPATDDAGDQPAPEEEPAADQPAEGGETDPAPAAEEPAAEEPTEDPDGGGR